MGNKYNVLGIAALATVAVAVFIAWSAFQTRTESTTQPSNTSTETSYKKVSAAYTGPEKLGFDAEIPEDWKVIVEEVDMVPLMHLSADPPKLHQENGEPGIYIGFYEVSAEEEASHFPKPDDPTVTGLTGVGTRLIDNQTAYFMSGVNEDGVYSPIGTKSYGLYVDHPLLNKHTYHIGAITYRPKSGELAEVDYTDEVEHFFQTFTFQANSDATF